MMRIVFGFSGIYEKETNLSRKIAPLPKSLRGCEKI
jgi:hypothetical protein